MFGPSHRLVKIFSLVLLTLFFYSLARTEFLVWNWNLFKQKPFQDILLSFVVGLRFDISAAFMVAAPLLLLAFIPWSKAMDSYWSSFTWILFCLLQVPFLLLNLGDVEFINFVGRRFSYDSLFILKEVPGKILNFVTSYWLLFIVNALILVIFVWSAKRTLSKSKSTNLIWPHKNLKIRKLWLSHVFLCFVTLILSVVGIRGGLQKKPISFVNANVFAAPLLNNLVLNSTFTFIKSYGAESLTRERYFTDKEEMLKKLNGSLGASLVEGHRPTVPQNVVIIILESFGDEYLGPVDGKSYTPFLDSLKSKALVFNNAYANGRRSIEGIGAIMAGIPALMNEPFISSHFTSNYFLGLGTLLNQKNYSTSFFHGGHNGTMYFDSFMRSAGVEKYFGAQEYGNSADDDGVWGIWDEPFLQWMITKLDSMPQPFMTSVFTLSSHQPFKVPEKYKADFPEGSIPILKTVAYTDFALKKFFSEAEKKPWFKNTLFLITADHTSLHYRHEYDNDIGNYKVPLFLFHPSYSFAKVDTDKVVQQVDILPTVLDFLGIAEKDKNYLGSSMFVEGDKVAFNFIDGRYILFAKDYFIRWSPRHGEPQMFAISDREAEKEIKSPSEMPRKNQLVDKLKATIQYFNEGMWDNKLYYPSH
ncbi:MAG: LTA synthase family protein [Pseudobdellovibrionaceae bacterium]